MILYVSIEEVESKKAQKMLNNRLAKTGAKWIGLALNLSLKVFHPRFSKAFSSFLKHLLQNKLCFLSVSKIELEKYMTQKGLEQCLKPKVCPSSCKASFVPLSIKSSVFGGLP